MNNVLLQMAIKLNTAYRKRKWWRRTVRTLAVLVVFCTTYILILPALTMQGRPECGFEEHIHSDSCYSLQAQPIHSHEAVCYDEQGVPVCSLPESTGDTPSAEAQRVLTCVTPEHIHTESCYPLEDEEKSEYRCGIGEHTHAEACYDASGELTCTIPEHSHEAACIQEVDPTADTQTPDQWQEKIPLTGNYPEDILAVAVSQLGYTESETNAVLVEDVLKHHNRYSAIYGDGYEDWSLLFVRYVLETAQVKDFPVENNTEGWIAALEAAERFGAADTYSPKAGDVIFLGTDRAGLVAELIPTAGNVPAQMKVIEGDVGGKVVSVTYTMDSPEITGYGSVPDRSIIQMIHLGEDYTVTATFPRGSNIPETAALSVQEILPGTEEYNAYYQQSVETLMAQNGAQTEADLDVSFARFFDITFLVDGEKVEPTAAVDIKIQYAERFKVEEGNAGMVVHFAESGTEVLDTDTNNGETDEADTFEFTQDSFSVSGTLVVARAATTATKVKPWEIDNTGNTMYVLYAQIGNAYYALDGNGYPVAITVNGHNLTLPSTNTDNLFWTFVDKPNDSTYYLYNPIRNAGTGRYIHPYNNGGGNQNVTTGNPYDAALVLNNNSNEDLITFKIRGANNNYIRYNAANQIATPTTAAYQATNFYVAQVGNGGATYNVWFDGTDGGMMSYYGAANENRPVEAGADGIATVELPETWQSSTKYDYKLRGWYDIYNYKYYPVNPDDTVTPTATISGNTVFYADWIAATYDVGQNNEHVVDSLDTNNFITTHVFDYNALFNVLSQKHTGSVSATGHSENWTVVNNGKVPYNDQNTLGFVFVDYDANGEFSYANDRDNTNINQGDAITAGILDEVKAASGQDLLDLLFNPETDVIGKYYAGQGNYLFQYMDSTTENYDGIHDGYYYLDARLNAASYNQTLQRFYLYDYLERTSDSRKDGGVGEYSDILPFNSPYIFEADQLDEYTDTIRSPGYEYDAKDGGTNHPEYNSLDDANTNYFFGIRTDIEFFLPNDAGTTDEYGNYGNISTRGEHMIFDFHGDDDVWVFIDGELVLDIGGLHGVMFGQIDFSSGTVVTGKDGGTTTTQTFTQLLGHNITEGTHSMTVYYMERGSSQSNCAIYFNIAPRYDLEITKEDIVSAGFLNGAVFTIYNDEAMTSPAQLWDSEAAHLADMEDGSIDDAKSSFNVVNGVAKCWGISAGKTYYIYETTPPPGYPASDDMIRITLNNRGTATIATTTLHGANGVATEGYAVIKQEINETLKIVALTVTNQKEGDHTEVRVEKTWAEGATNLPQSITVYLTADGVPLGRRAVLSESNGWSYTWTGLNKYRSEGIDEEIVYEVQEVLVPDYITTQGETVKVENYTDWIRVDQMSDSKTFLLVHNGQALTYNGSFGWMSQEDAKKDDSLSAQWNVTTDHDGFHLKNGLGYTLTYSNSGFYGVDDDRTERNQVFYYLNSRLMAHDHDVYYQFGTNGSVVSEDGLAFTLYQKEVMTGFLTNIINVPVDEDDQTYVEVNKVWSDGAEKHVNGLVIIRLYADGRDTGRYITLNAGNDWKGGFYDLPYYREDGVTPVVYTVVEDDVDNYVAQYSQAVVLPGLEVQIWQDVTAISANGTYRFVSGANSLAVDADNNVVSAHSDLNDTYQQWTAVSYNNRIILRNVGSKRYLALSGSSLYTTSRATSAAAITLSNELVRVGQMYLEITASHAGVTSNAANISGQKITQYVTTHGQPGTGYAVTNLYGAYTLPVTGGMGTLPFTFGGLAMIAAALMYMYQNGRKRQKGGKYD